MRASRRRPHLRPTLLVGALLLISCASSDYAHLYYSAPHAPSITPDDIQNLRVLGPVFSDKGVNFSVYAGNATKVQLLLFDNPDSNQPSKVFDLYPFGPVWSVYVEGVGTGQAYGYRAWGPNWPYDPSWYPGSIAGFQADVDLQGNRYNPNKLLFDPYSKAITRDHDWSRGSAASGPERCNVDYAAAMKSVIVQSKYQWSSGELQYRKNRQDPNLPGHRWNNLIIYEVHPKGFTMNSASGVMHPGTYLGIAEKADYLKDLGVTAVQLMPVFQKPQDGGYWGYQTLNFFTPESSYANAVLPTDRIDEFKYMVDQLHQRNIEVILDVVYNHTGEGGLWRQKIQYGGATLDQTLDPRDWANYDPKTTAGIYAYRGLDNQAYYALNQSDPGYYNDSMTGVGNATLSNQPPFRNLILDSLHYWVQEMHVDGFRFDLAVELGAVGENLNCLVNDSAGVQTTVLQDIIDDPILQRYNTRVIAEPWGMGCYGLGGFPASTTLAGDGWYEHNGQFRDWWRSFINYSTWPLNAINGTVWGVNPDGAFLMYGSEGFYYQPGSTLISKRRRPYNSVNFLTVHDGFTLYDVFSYNQKENGCGPLAPDCCQPVTAYCNNDGSDDNRSYNWGQLSPTEDVACGADATCVNTKCPNWQSYWSSPPPDTATCQEWWCGANGNCINATIALHEQWKRQFIRDSFLALMFSRGTPMLLGGDEWMRTQLGNNNAYTTRADNEFNWFDWGAWQASDPAWRMHDFVRQLIAFRKQYAYAFAPDAYDTAAEMDWLDDNAVPASMDPNMWNGRSMEIHFPDRTRGPELLILINMESASTAFTLPPGTWERLISTDLQYETISGASPGTDQARMSGNVNLTNPPLVPDNPHVVSTRTIEVLQAL